MKRALRNPITVLLGIFGCAPSACRADDSVLAEIFACDPEAGDAQCGTDENGEPMTCYVESAQLGGTAFCTKRCDPNRQAEPGYTCMGSGALIERCHPGREDIACQGPLQCYRTDILLDLGLCLWVPTCEYDAEEGKHDDRQCGISHPICAGAVLQSLVAGSELAALVQTDNLHCVAEPPCATNGCPNTGLVERCPSEFYQIDYGLPITCAATCDEFACPPNFACAASANPGSPSLCLPGVFGVRCKRDEDCLIGDCIDTGAGFSVCTMPAGCETQEDCLRFGSTPPLVCAGTPGEKAYCVSQIPFQGANCQDSSDCATDLICGDEACPPQECAFYSPFEFYPEHGECRFACDGECPAFGGLPHACIDGTCYPQMFGVECFGPTDCFERFTCGTVPPDERSSTDAPSICTIACLDDSDCTNATNPWMANGYCVPVSDPPPDANGYCRPGGRPDNHCEKDAHCESRKCRLTEEGVYRCEAS